MRHLSSSIRDAKTGFVFFNIEGICYDYDAAARTLRSTDGRLLISEGSQGTGPSCRCGRGRRQNFAWCNHAADRDAESRQRRDRIRRAAAGRRAERPFVPGPMYRRRSALHAAVWQQRNAGRLGSRNHLLQHRQRGVELVCDAEHRPSGHSAEPLSDERRREQQRTLRTDRPILAEARVHCVAAECLRLWLHSLRERALGSASAVPILTMRA